jgi:phosphatidylglycerophosphate synthase
VVPRRERRVAGGDGVDRKAIAAVERATRAEVRATYKARDAWWTVLLVDPIAGWLVRLVSPYRWITANRLTVASFAVGLGAAACFVRGGPPWLVAGALLYHVSFILDCVDGKIARLRRDWSILGGWLDFVLDRIRVVLCAMALMGGQYRLTRDSTYLILATVIVALILFRYLNSAQIEELEATIARRVEAAHASAGRPLADTDRAVVAREHAGMDELQSRIGLLASARAFLARHRIRAHVVSGVEFEMAVFVVAPLAGAVAPSALIAVPVATGAILLLFEGAFVYRLWLAARAASRTLAMLDTVVEANPANGPR